MQYIEAHLKGHQTSVLESGKPIFLYCFSTDSRFLLSSACVCRSSGIDSEQTTSIQRPYNVVLTSCAPPNTYAKRNANKDSANEFNRSHENTQIQELLTPPPKEGRLLEILYLISYFWIFYISLYLIIHVFYKKRLYKKLEAEIGSKKTEFLRN